MWNQSEKTKVTDEADGAAHPGDCTADVQEDAEDAGTQVDLPGSTEQFEECQKTANPTKNEHTEAAEDPQQGLLGDAEQLEKRVENVANSTATVKVVLVPEGQVMTVAFAIGLSVQELKSHLASELRVPTEVLQLSLDGRVVEEQKSLMELGVRPHSSTQMEMSSTDPGSHPLRLLRPSEHDSMPDVITVQVQKDEGLLKEVVVEIERSSQQKPFLGGYRNRLSGVEFHHAAVQTAPKKRPDRGVVVFSHHTQTVELKSHAQQCPVDTSTQMTGIGCYVCCVEDKLLTPGKYITADKFHGRRLKASFARRWLARQAVDRLRRERNRRMAWLEMQEKKRQEEKEEQLRDRRERWTNPQRREDFNLLYHSLEKWRSEEEQKINSTLQGAERRAALCLLLEQETQLIAAIGRHRLLVQANNHDRVIRDFLNKSAASHQWRTLSGRLLEMDTPHTIRARQLRDLYNNISMDPVSETQRLHFLMTLNDTVKEHDCQLTQDIVDLISREMDLMTRGVKASSLEGLRKRVCTLFLQYIKTPAFNPNVAKLLKVPQNPSQLKNDMFLCSGCYRYLRSADFDSSASSSLRRRCQHCAGVDNIARTRDDLSLYKSILRKLRADEQQLSKESMIPFLLQVEDMRYLTEVVWSSRSALNGSKDLYSLVFVRWEQHMDWSPWNCLLLSKEETSSHLEVKDVHKRYGISFIRWVEQKHAMARHHFSQIPILTKYLESQAAA